MTELAPSLQARPVLGSADAVRAFYLFEASLMTVIVLAGFWPFYAGLVAGGTVRHPVIYLHAAVFTGWLVLMISQVLLVYVRKVRIHQRVGRAAIGYAIALLVLGIAVSIILTVERVTAGESTVDAAAGFLVLPLGDLLLFGGLFAAGIHYRRAPATHKRLMLLATNALVFPGAARLGDPSIAMIFGLWFLPIVLAMAFDQFTTGRIHRVYYIGVAVMLVFFMRVGLIDAELWLAIGRRIVGAFL
ncbi:MAG TPA: hypothetical protein VMN81_01265 [Vicinamibacterales bacterium]|nr:hypothetical protein [Vicinamibacterales bacterium]